MPQRYQGLKPLAIFIHRSATADRSMESSLFKKEIELLTAHEPGEGRARSPLRAERGFRARMRRPPSGRPTFGFMGRKRRPSFRWVCGL